MQIAPPAPIAPTAPATPPAPAIAPAAGNASVTAAGPAASGMVSDGGLATPRTREQLEALRRHRSEVVDQLSSVQHRRDDLAKQLRNPMVGGADRAGIEQRLTVVDGRIVSLERDLDATGQLIAVAPTALLSTSIGVPGIPRHAFRSGFVGGAGLSLLAVLLYTRVFHRSRVGAFTRADTFTPPADSARLARVEQAIEAVAIEVERISEGQRFVTQLLADRAGEARLTAPVYAAPGEAPR